MYTSKQLFVCTVQCTPITDTYSLLAQCQQTVNQLPAITQSNEVSCWHVIYCDDNSKLQTWTDIIINSE